MIEFVGVGHRFGEREVLAEVGLALPQRRVGFVGANGSGKSTLARTINGLVRPTTGRVLVDGLDPARSGSQVRRRVGFVFTNPDSQIVMPTAGEDVAFSLRRSGLPRAERADRAAAVLAEHGLAGYADHPAHQLSGGQKQLLALCAVLVLDPDVLVCDEPTTLLDLRNKHRFGELLTGLRQQVVLVTHDLDLLAGFERVVVLEAGRVVADDEPAPALRYYRELAR
jgi:biotin transport system ATP-binding protein